MNYESRIAIFSLAYPPFVGGAELAVKEITGRLPYNFICFTHRFEAVWPEREIIGNVEAVRVRRGPKLFYIFRAWRAAEKFHREKPFDAIWAVMAAYAGLAALLFKLFHPKVPLLLTLQEGDSEAHILRRVGIFYPFWRLIFKKADRIQAISNYLADFARRHGARCPIEVAPNGVDLEKFGDRIDRNARVEKIDQAKRSIKQSDRTSIIITASRLVYKNGIDVLIRAAAQLKFPIPNSQFLIRILGGGPDEQKLKKLAQDLGISDKVEFLGHVDPAKIPDYLAQADIFVRPSRSEGLGSSFLEAMAAGLPVIGTPVGGIPDFLHDAIQKIQIHSNHSNGNSDSSNRNYGPNGLFVKPDDPADLAEKIAILLKDEKLRKRLGDNGRRLVLENYSWDKISQKIKNIFNSLITNNQSLITRLLIAAGLYPPEIGGPATYTALLEQELLKRGIKVSVAPFSAVRRLPIGIRHLIYFLKCFFFALRTDIVYAQDPVSVGLPALCAARLAGKPFIIRVAGDYAWEQGVQRFGVKDGIDEFNGNSDSANRCDKYPWQARLLIKIQKFVTNQAKAVITPSRYFQKLVSGWVRNPEKVKVVYNGLDLNAIQKIQIPSNNSNGNSDSSNRKTILSAGRLVPWKGFDVLIEIMKELPDWKLIIAGDGPERESLKLQITNYQLQNRVKLVGAVSRGELLEYFGKAEIFILNSSFESFSFQIVEAMNAGVPVITTKIGDLEEIIDDGKEGILTEPNNKIQLLAAIKKFDQDRDFRKKIVGAARIKARSFSLDKTADEFLQICSTFIKN
jgi:glycosyltransferase involved in cell wall biosynthesis